MTQVNLLSKQSSLLYAIFCFQHTAIQEWAYCVRQKAHQSQLFLLVLKSRYLGNHTVLVEVQTVHIPRRLSWLLAEHGSWNSSALCPVVPD